MRFSARVKVEVDSEYVCLLVVRSENARRRARNTFFPPVRLDTILYIPNSFEDEFDANLATVRPNKLRQENVRVSEQVAELPLPPFTLFQPFI